VSYVNITLEEAKAPKHLSNDSGVESCIELSPDSCCLWLLLLLLLLLLTTRLYYMAHSYIKASITTRNSQLP
jgi:hypothetical protein